MKKLKIKQVKSGIGRTLRQKRTLVALEPDKDAAGKRSGGNASN
ncbi:MAG: hypothetical protein R2764_25085 [Bacteroidales bacterium]